MAKHLTNGVGRLYLSMALHTRFLRRSESFQRSRVPFMQLRQLEQSDCEFVTSVVDEWWGGRSVRQLLPRLFFEHFNDTSLVLTEESGIIAFLVGFRSQSQPHVAYIHFIGVDPAQRGKGLARMLYLKFFEHMKSLGCTEVQCITSPVNKTSIAFHTAMSFNIVPGDSVVDDVPVHRHHAGAEQHRVVFCKMLD